MAREGRLSGRVALISGGASGIGAACAQRFAAEGARIAALDVQSPLEEIWKRIRDHDEEAFFVEADVRDEDTIAASVSTITERFGSIDILVNAAGVHGTGSVDSLDSTEWDRVVDINLKGTYLVSKHVVSGMMERERGNIINLASVEGLEGLETQAAYNASKGGVVLLTRNMACDYGRYGVRVNCLCPGYIETPMTQILSEKGLEEIRQRFIDFHLLRRSGSADEVAAAALFLASDDASFVTGHALAVDGGFTAGRLINTLAG